MEIENAVEVLNTQVEYLITVKLSKMSKINHLEKMRLNHIAKVELIDLKIKNLEKHIIF